MLQALAKPTSLTEFLDWKPEDGCYELRNGVIVEMQPTGKREEVLGFIVDEIGFQVRQRKLPYFLPKQVLIKSPTEGNTAYLPDVAFVDRSRLVLEPMWEKRALLAMGASVPLIVEVVSTNWRDDYHKKFADYEAIGVPEYWIADYLGLGGIRFIGSPKQPTLTICALVDGEYQMQLFREGDRIVSPLFPDLELTAAQVLLLDSNLN
jgi:Uma2 family endonuclease